MSAAGLGPAIGAVIAPMIAVSAAVWCWRRPGRVAPVTCAVAAVSVAVTAVHLPHGDGTVATHVWGLVETSGVLALVVSLVRHARPLVALGVCVLAGVAVGGMLARVLPSVDAPTTLVMCGFWSLSVLPAAAAGVYLRTQRAAHLRAMERAETDQRRALAADLHDFVAHEVSAMLFQAQAARLMATSSPDRTAAALDQIERLGQRALGSLDRSVAMLQRPAGDRMGLADVSDLVRRYSAVGPAPVALHLAVEPSACSAAVSELAYRVVVEALTNVRRHAPASRAIGVDIRGTTPSGLTIVVTNALDPPADPRSASDSAVGRTGSGTGIAHLTRRVVALGGRMSAGPTTHPTTRHEWRLVAEIPLTAAEA